MNSPDVLGDQVRDNRRRKGADRITGKTYPAYRPGSFTTTARIPPGAKTSSSMAT